MAQEDILGVRFEQRLNNLQKSLQGLGGYVIAVTNSGFTDLLNQARDRLERLTPAMGERNDRTLTSDISDPKTKATFKARTTGTLRNSWRLVIRGNPQTSQFSAGLTNTDPRAFAGGLEGTDKGLLELLEKGAPPHNIPGPLSFWWVKENRGAYLAAGGEVKHPGFAPYNFLIANRERTRKDFNNLSARVRRLVRRELKKRVSKKAR